MNGHGDPELAAHFAADLEDGEITRGKTTTRWEPEAKERSEDESTPHGRLIDAIRDLAADGENFSGHELMEIISESDWLKEHDQEVRLYARQQPDPAPEWQSWPMITAGDGRHYERLAPAEGRARWRQVGYHWRLTDDEIAALGPVRRCVPVTLPDEWDDVTLGSVPGDVILEGGLLTTGMARRIAAELLAAALHAEEGPGS